MSQLLTARSHHSIVVCLLIVIAGCNVNQDDPIDLDVIEPGLPVIRGSQLEEYVQTSELPVLVEFGVDFNCTRCAQTKSPVVRLREALVDEVDVIRVDFNANTQLVAQLGGTVCPTYVLFNQGTPVMTRSFPISIDLLEGEILRRTEQ